MNRVIAKSPGKALLTILKGNDKKNPKDFGFFLDQAPEKRNENLEQQIE